MAVGGLALGDVLGHGHEVPVDRLAGLEVEVVVVRPVGDKGVECALVVPELVLVGRRVHVQLRRRRRVRLERVVAGEHHELVEARDRDAVLVVVPAHPVDGLRLAVLHVVRDDDACLLGAGGAGVIEVGPGHAVPLRKTQSCASSFVKRIGCLKPSIAVAR